MGYGRDKLGRLSDREEVDDQLSLLFDLDPHLDLLACTSPPSLFSPLPFPAPPPAPPSHRPLSSPSFGSSVMDADQHPSPCSPSPPTPANTHSYSVPGPLLSCPTPPQPLSHHDHFGGPFYSLVLGGVTDHNNHYPYPLHQLDPNLSYPAYDYRRPHTALAPRTMNGGVLFETSAPTPHSSAPALKQELITDHYGVTMSGKRSHKDKLNRQAAPSPTYSAQADSQAAYATPQTGSMSGSAPTFPPAPYPYQSAPHAYPNGQLYYPYSQPQLGGQHQGVQQYAQASTSAGPSNRRNSQEARPLYTNTPLYETNDALNFNDSTNAAKRKREGSPSKMQTPKRHAKSKLPETNSGARTVKRVKVDDAPPSVQSQLPTPPSTGRNVSNGSLPSHQDVPEDMSQHGVYVTVTEEEGRKLGLVRNSTGDEAIEQLRERAPPRLSSSTTLAVNEAGVASLVTTEVLASELAWLEREAESSDSRPEPSSVLRTPISDMVPLPDDVKDTPKTREDKTSRRLKAFSSQLPSPGGRSMFSVRVNTRHGEMSRVALRKEKALAFIKMDDVIDAVEEVRRDDEDEWASSHVAGPSSRSRPDWPENEGQWRASAKKAREQRQERERSALLRRYLETPSDDEHEAADEQLASTRKGKNVIRARSRNAPISTDWQIYPSDARDALLYSLRKTTTTSPAVAMAAAAAAANAAGSPAGVINCVCKSAAPGAGSLISCSSCRTWHHVACVGLDEIQADWVCDTCVGAAQREALMATPAVARTPRGYAQSNERSAYKGDAALALAPSPMFGADPLRGTLAAIGAARTPMTFLGAPGSPSRPQRARVLSYGGDIWGLNENEHDDSPSTPAPIAARLPERFATPRLDDPIFDVNSTPSRHLDTDPRLAGTFNSLFSMTPLMSRSRNPSNLLATAGDTPGPAGRNRNVSGVPPFADLVPTKHEFLQGLQGLTAGGSVSVSAADRVRSAASLSGPASAALATSLSDTGAVGGMNSPASPSVIRRGPTGALLGAAQPVSPSPFARRTLSGNKFSHLRSSSRSGLGLGMSLDEDEERVDVEVDSD